MRTSSAIAAVLALTFSIASALAQTPPLQDHNAHHPQDQGQPGAPSPPSGDKGGMTGGMMCADMMGKQAGDMRQMMPMMQNMMAMMSMQSGMMAAHVDGRIAALKTELKITEAQTPQWNRFADALRATASSMNEMHKTMMPQDKAAKSLPDQMAAREQMMTTHLASLKAVREALLPLYATLTDDQKEIANKIMIGPMGMM